MNTAIAELNLIEVANCIRSKQISSEEVTRVCLERVDKLQPSLNCFISINADHALTAAKAADNAIAAGADIGLLHGVPLAHKDMFYREGFVSTGGSAIQGKFTPNYTATVIKKLEAAGAICLGGLNMSEFASGPVGQNQHFGDCRNPWDVERAPGGSSSGSGSAVAARLVYGALGSDTGGSVRIPAALCGLVGMKGTQGRVSRRGGMPLSFSLDCFGPLARTASDCARLFYTIAGEDCEDPTASQEPLSDYEQACAEGVKGIRIGYDSKYGGIKPSSDVVRAIMAAVELYKDLGVQVVEVKTPNQDELNALSNIITRSEAATIHKKWLKTKRNLYSPQVRRRIEIGLGISATRYLEALSLRAHHLKVFNDAIFSKCDAMILPTVGEEAPTLQELDVGDSEALPSMLRRLTGYTRPINYYGLPAISIPAGFSKKVLPIGFQIVGKPFDEALLFRLAGAFQQYTDYHKKSPILSGIE
ncbi:MAG: Asp-tRNA(Asn)/Glu-tRNA(Gln) amidotransferase GatCAB subunit A [Rhodospirillaceae bacterium]|nr:Asp-tRNA(Asn)/Glu-tRNA(Gln) amidotransferase GatCAB subunit A [Rhodospirillaceae bacterium]|tara:strand:+ start:662 stop:2086 length:1425 start_codon:yes stop_codon:yes gene_type:complete